MAVSPLGWGLCAAFGAVPKSVPSAGTPTAHMGWGEGAVLVPSWVTIGAEGRERGPPTLMAQDRDGLWLHLTWKELRKRVKKTLM